MADVAHLPHGVVAPTGLDRTRDWDLIVSVAPALWPFEPDATWYNAPLLWALRAFNALIVWPFRYSYIMSKSVYLVGGWNANHLHDICTAIKPSVPLAMWTDLSCAHEVERNFQAVLVFLLSVVYLVFLVFLMCSCRAAVSALLRWAVATPLHTLARKGQLARAEDGTELARFARAHLPSPVQDSSPPLTRSALRRELAAVHGSKDPSPVISAVRQRRTP